jgi:malonyl-CoA O-methyltransferase
VADLTVPLRDARRLLRSAGQVTIIEIHPFLSLVGAKAHFQHGGDEIHMPTFAHQFPAYLAAFEDAGLRFVRCREWHPCDITGEVPPKVLKRGAQTPVVVAFELCVPGAEIHG